MKVVKKIGKIFLIIFILFIVANVGLYIYCLITPKILINKNPSYYLYDKDDSVIFNNYNWVNLDDISPYVIDATLSTEDKHFYKHFGLDYLRIAKAMWKNVTSFKLSEGASTITQQYARNLYLSYEKTWKRKIEEAILAFELEVHYNKDEILEGYLNTINYGGVFGIENASKYYFNKSANELNLAEASMLAGIPQSPMNNNPLMNLDSAKKRQNVVLSLMVKNNKITDKDKELALDYDLNYVGDSNSNITSGILYYKDAVIKELNSIDSIPKSFLETGGIKIYTTLDTEAQSCLEESANSNKIDSDMQISALMVNPSNGEAMALLGGFDYNTSQFNRAISSKRQVGSTMKPFLYYAALESGFTSASSFISEKTIFNFSNNKTYSPKNYNDKYANGPISMGTALAYSDNIYAVKTHLFLGEDVLVNMASRMGLGNNFEAVPSLPLGTEEISLYNMVNAYASFANLGNKVKTHFIRRVEDFDGNILYEFKEESSPLLNESLVYILNEMLTYTYDPAFIDYNYPNLISLLPKISKKYSIKTGTTDTDNWIIGYNADFVLGIWSGYDDNRNMESEDTRVHRNVWIDTVENYFKDKTSKWYTMPNNVVGVMVNPLTGEISKDEDKNKKIFYFIKGTEPHNNSTYDLESVFQEENSENEKKE